MHAHDSSLVAYQHDERLPKIRRAFFRVFPRHAHGVSKHIVSSRFRARASGSRASVPLTIMPVPGAEIRLQRGERVWLNSDADQSRARVAVEPTAHATLGGLYAGWRSSPVGPRRAHAAPTAIVAARRNAQCAAGVTSTAAADNNIWMNRVAHLHRRQIDRRLCLQRLRLIHAAQNLVTEARPCDRSSAR